MDAKLLGAFRASAESTFRDMFGIEAKAAAPRELDSQEDHGWDITGLVGLAGQAHGVVAFRLTRELAARLLAGSGVAAASDAERKELEGGLVAEVTNIVAGAATSALEGLDVEIAPPVVIRGPNHKIGWPAIAPVLALGFSIPEGSFELDLCMRY